MDPKACWQRIVDAIGEGDFLEAACAAEDLDQWRSKGGFRPEGIPADVWRMGALRDFARLCRAARLHYIRS